MAVTYKLINKTILSANQTSVSFTGLGSYSSDYTDLKFVFSPRGSNGDAIRGLYFSINGSTSNFSQRFIRGYGTGIDCSQIARFTGDGNASGSTSNTFSSIELYIPNFSNSNNKSYSVDWASENNSGSAYAATMGFITGLWSNTSAITSIAIAYDAGDFVSGSSFYLYGIKNS
jgi:hypothetical protein